MKKPKSSQDGVLNEGGEDLPLDPHQQKMLKLEKDFELALKNGKPSTRRRRKDEEDIVSGFSCLQHPIPAKTGVPVYLVL